MEEDLNQKKLKELKAHAYDMIGVLEQAQASLNSTNNQIREIKKVIEEENIKKSKTKTEEKEKLPKDEISKNLKKEKP
jgi:hypothetical protein